MGKRLSICHLGKYYPPAPGGIESHVQSIARAQSALGHEVSVICINHLDRHGRDVTYARYGMTRTQSDRDGDVRLTRLGRSATFARLDFVPDLKRTIKHLTRNPVDILHLHAPNPTMLILAAALRQTTPIIITHHSDIVRQRLLRYAHGPLENLVYDRASAILASTPVYAEGSPVLRKYSEKVRSLPFGMDLSAFEHPSRAALQVRDGLLSRFGPTIWLSVGRVVYYKGLHVAIDALRSVPGVLVIVGKGPLRGELEARAREMGVDDRVVWWGHATPEELIGAYHAATGLWFPSSARSEAFGLVQVEAMASGCPVINTSIVGSGVAWVSPHEQTGLTVPVNDPSALAEASRRLLEEPGLRARLSDGARNRAKLEFSARTMAERSVAIYREVLRQRRVEVGLGAESDLSSWVRRMSETLEPVHANLAPVRGEPLRGD
jgi:rhamnosyl/mannosyltransferase